MGITDVKIEDFINLHRNEYERFLAEEGNPFVDTIFSNDVLGSQFYSDTYTIHDTSYVTYTVEAK